MQIKDLTIDQCSQICENTICDYCPLHSKNIADFSHKFKGCVVFGIPYYVGKELWDYEISGYDCKRLH